LFGCTSRRRVRSSAWFFRSSCSRTDEVGMSAETAVKALKRALSVIDDAQTKLRHARDRSPSDGDVSRALSELDDAESQVRTD